MTIALYRHFGEGDELLYIGVSLSTILRLSQHRTHSGWYPEIRRVTVEPFKDRHAALIAETEAIAKEQPKYNVQKKKLVPQPLPLPEPHRVETLNRLFRTTVIEPAYTIKRAAEFLSMRPIDITRLVESGEIGSFEAPPRHGEKATTTYISGWQIIDWLDSMNALSNRRKKP